MSDHRQDALIQISELAMITQSLVSQCIAVAPPQDDLPETLVAARSMCKLIGVTCERYGADVYSIDEHLLPPVHLDHLEKFEKEAEQ